MSRVSRRKLAQGAVGAMILGAAPAASAHGDADERLSELIAEHHRFEWLAEAAQDEADAANAAERRAIAQEIPHVAALYHRVEALHREQGKVANAIINLPAASFVGMACKLILWRHEAALCSPDDFDSAHESFTFSAYLDALRLTGLTQHANPNDRATRALMARYWL